MITRQELPPESGVALIPGVDVETQTNIILSVLVILLVFLVRRAILAVVHGRTDDSELRYRWAKMTANIGFDHFSERGPTIYQRPHRRATRHTTA